MYLAYRGQDTRRKVGLFAEMQRGRDEERAGRRGCHASASGDQV